MALSGGPAPITACGGRAYSKPSIIKQVKIKWSHDLGPNGSGAGVMTTAAGLIFTGDAQGSVMALRTTDGKTLWHAGQGQSMQSSPITYELDGRQYVITSGGGVMFALALPEK